MKRLKKSTQISKCEGWRNGGTNATTLLLSQKDRMVGETLHLSPKLNQVCIHARPDACTEWWTDSWMDRWMDWLMDWFSLGFLGLCWNFPRFSATTGEKNAEQWCHRISVSLRSKTVRRIAAEAHNQSSMRNSWIGWLPTCFFNFC